MAYAISADRTPHYDHHDEAGWGRALCSGAIAGWLLHRLACMTAVQS